MRPEQLVGEGSVHLRQLLFSSASLMASQVLTAGVGFLFWVVAARRFDEASVGVASAAISAMSLLGAIGTVGMGTLLIREMPLNRGSEHRMLSAALLLSSGLGAALGLAFVLLAPLLSDEFAPLVADPWVSLSVIVGSGLTAAGLNMDQALVGLLRSELQLVRNIVAAGGRLLLLLATAVAGSLAGSLAMLGSWSGALALSMLALALIALRRGQLRSAVPPAWRILHFHRAAALRHHMLNLSIQVPGWVMPLITLTVLSAATNARFYLAWMLVGLASFVPAALCWALYASSSRDISSLARNGRITLALSVAAAVISALMLWLLGAQILTPLGASYAEAAAGPLPVLAMTLLPVAIKSHFVTIHRVRGTLNSASLVVAGAGLVEIVGAILGAHLGDLTGLSVGLLTAMLLEAAVMLPTVYEAIVSPRGSTNLALEEKP
jgi:O-antigen/teichoic acid export membrane protein